MLISFNNLYGTDIDKVLVSTDPVFGEDNIQTYEPYLNFTEMMKSHTNIGMTPAYDLIAAWAVILQMDTDFTKHFECIDGNVWTFNSNITVQHIME